MGKLSIKPKMPEGSVRNQMKRTISVWSERKFWVHFDRSYQSDRNVPFHLTKFFCPVLLLYILHTRTIWRTLVSACFHISDRPLPFHLHLHGISEFLDLETFCSTNVVKVQVSSILKEKRTFIARSAVSRPNH